MNVKAWLVGVRVRASRNIPQRTGPTVPGGRVGTVEDIDKPGNLYAVDFGEPYGVVMTTPGEIEQNRPDGL